jgi:hypothetical protein
MEQGEGNLSFDYCKGCSYLDERPQIQYLSENVIVLPYCEFYNLHFASVRQIEQCSKTCLHYDGGHV